MTQPIRILTVDDHPVLREGIAALIAPEPLMTVVGEAGNGVEAIDQFRKLSPDVTLMDVQMPVMSGIEAIAAIRRESPHARIIVLTTYTGDAQAIRALRLGASGYLLKSALRKELIETVRAVFAGRRSLPPEIASAIALHAADPALTERETSVLRLIAAGAGNKRVARELMITEETVKAHLKSIFAKLDVADRTHAVTIALKRGIIEL